MLWTFCICTPSALYLDDPCNQDTEIELIQLGWICFSDILRQSLDGGDFECISGEEAVLQVVRIPRIPAQEASPQFLNENYNQHSNANCQCQGRFDAKRDLPGSFQIGKNSRSALDCLFSQLFSTQPQTLLGRLDKSSVERTLASYQFCAHPKASKIRLAELALLGAHGILGTKWQTQFTW